MNINFYSSCYTTTIQYNKKQQQQLLLLLLDWNNNHNNNNNNRHHYHHKLGESAKGRFRAGAFISAILSCNDLMTLNIVVRWTAYKRIITKIEVFTPTSPL